MAFGISKSNLVRRSGALLSVAILILSSCTRSDTEDFPIVSADGEVEFVFSLPATRADIGEDGSGTFEDGDRIGLYVYGSPSRHFILTRQNGSWTPRFKKSDLGSGLVTLSAYYPAREDVQPETEKHFHTVSADQSGEGFDKSDLLWAHRVINMDNLAGNAIDLPFSHGMHRLQIQLTVADGEFPSDLSVEVRNRNEGSFSLFLGKPQLENSNEVWITPRPGARQGEFTALLFPQELGPYTTGAGLVRIKTGGKTVTYKAPDKVGESGALESGKTTKLNLRLTENGIEPDPEEPDVEFANKTCWIYGVKNPDYPRDDEASVPTVSPLVETFPAGTWFYTADRAFFNWQENCGWYDCDKDNPAVDDARPGGYSDWNMCWAASASNLLTWWMYHNREYIKLYDQKYGTDPWPQYPRPSAAFPGDQTSEIFDFFRETCRNIGSSSHFGVNWFITGAIRGIPAQSEHVYNNFGGYFSELFPSDISLATNTTALYKEDFNRIIKDAFRNNRALGFDVGYVYGGAHAMVIWGAEFDETGTVSAIYYVDNNDRYNFETIGVELPPTVQRHRLIRYPVTYRETGVYMGTTSTVINALNEVDLGRDIWEREFGKLPEPQE